MNESIFRHSTDIQIRFNDIDGQQHVNNAIYQAYYDLGRKAYLEEIQRKEFETGGDSVIIAAVKTDFREPIFLNDRVAVETMVAKIGNKSITMDQRIIDKSTGRIKSVCTTVFSGYDYEAAETRVISREMRSAISEFEKRDF